MQLRKFGWAVAVTVLAGGVAGASESAGGTEKEHRMKIVVAGGDPTNRIVLDDLDELAVGQSRETLTEAGERVTVSRDEQGFDVEFENGKKLRIGDPEDGGAFAFAEGDGDHDVLIVRRHGGADGDELAWHGVDGEVELAEGDGLTKIFVGNEGAPFSLVVEDVIEGLAASERFQGLDASTRATVIEALRELEPTEIKTFHRTIERKRVPADEQK